MGRLLRTALSLGLLSSFQTAFASFMPPNDLHLQDNLRSHSGISERDFNDAMAEVREIFAPIVEAHGAKLNLVGNWNDSTVNAYAQQNGKTWNVNMFGGLARREEVTRDGFTLVICHELGHHLGGYPTYEGFNNTWAASEGQSDYFATQACAKKLWRGQYEENKKAGKLALPAAKKMCDEHYSNEDDQNLCYRTAAGGQSLANLLAALGGSQLPKPETPDKTVVKKTVTAHPKAQCRLDTYLRGSFCTVEFDYSVIPGKGMSGVKAETEAYKYSCSAAIAAEATRPACWFKSLSRRP